MESPESKCFLCEKINDNWPYLYMYNSPDSPDWKCDVVCEKCYMNNGGLETLEKYQKYGTNCGKTNDTRTS